MKKFILIAALLLVGCTTSVDSAFRKTDVVKVTNGFYKDKVGVVLNSPVYSSEVQVKIDDKAVLIPVDYLIIGDSKDLR